MSRQTSPINSTVQSGQLFTDSKSTHDNYVISSRSPKYVPSPIITPQNLFRLAKSPQRRFLLNDCDGFYSHSPSQSGQLNLRRLNSEQIIDLMEREQDAIVLKLMKEITLLKEENRLLKTLSHSSSLTPSSSSASTPSSSNSPSYIPPSSGAIKRSLSVNSKESQFLHLPTTTKRKLSDASCNRPDEAFMMKKENEQLKSEIASLRKLLANSKR